MVLDRAEGGLGSLQTSLDVAYGSELSGRHLRRARALASGEVDVVLGHRAAVVGRCVRPARRREREERNDARETGRPYRRDMTLTLSLAAPLHRFGVG
jgi:hypothetical protein